ncbi:TRAP-type C4-dicarboxylate transport system, small permease component [Palleronia salina]|uniref:TRAP transporter small permease protein n=1 Tax=Palleronia salina TaxID=313368 RepID=A0A1M6K3Z4_9RHOB|nr:TRAP transporter small permease [Palleronia salina]SHJ53625.1 TRAP-type C4-dicarboxylate transport system, small permease component [Palleronia salina]
MRVGTLLSRVISLWALLGGVLLLVIVLATAVNAIGFTANTVARSWGGNVPGLPGYEDAVTMLVGVAALAMFPYCQLHGGHAAVDIFMQKAPPLANRVVSVLSGLLVIAVAGTMAVMLVQGTLETRSDNVETAVLGWPVWIFMPFAVVSCVLWAIAAFLETFVTGEARDGA